MKKGTLSRWTGRAISPCRDDIGATAMTGEICEPFRGGKVRRALLDRIIHGRKENETRCAGIDCHSRTFA